MNKLLKHNHSKNNLNISYEGNFEENLKNGIGIEEYNEGNIYKGEFKNGKKKE